MISDLSSFYKGSTPGLFLLLISFYPVFSLVGPFFENLNILLLGFVSFFYLLKNKNFLNFKDFFLASFFLILFFYNLKTGSNNDLVKSIKYLIYLSILLFCLKIKFKKNHFSLIKKVFKFITLTLFVLYTDILVQKFFGYNIIGYETRGCYFDDKIIENCRVSSFFDDEYVAGSFISRVVVIVSLYYSLIEKNYLLLIPTLIFSLISIFFTGERMALGFNIQILAIFFVYIVILKKIELNFFKILSIFSIFFLAIIFLVTQNTSIRYSKGLDLIYNKDYFQMNISENKIEDIDYFQINKSFLDKEFKIMPNQKYGYYSSNEIKKNLTNSSINNLNFVPTFLKDTTFTIDTESLQNKNAYIQIISTTKVNTHFFNSTGWSAHFIAAWKIFEKNILLGSGFKSFYNECIKLDKINHIYDSHKCSIHPHNFHLEILQSTGLIGYLSFLILIYSLFVSVFRNKSLRTLDKLLITMILLIIFNPITTSGSIFSSSFSNKLWLISSIVIFLTRFKGYKNEFN